MSRLSLAQGTRAAFVLGIVGAITPPALMLGITITGWLLHGTSDFDLRYDLVWLQDRMVGPTVGCATLFACAGWATNASAGDYRFASSLVILLSTSVVLWFILGIMSITPQRLKDIEHPQCYPSELLVLISPPICSAIGLRKIRSRRPEQKFLQVASSERG